MAVATGSTPDRFPWHGPDAVGELAARHHTGVRVHDGVLSITAESAEAYFAANEQLRPMSVAGRPILERAGSYSQVREQALAILRNGNEDPAAFRVSRPYRVIEVRRSSRVERPSQILGDPGTRPTAPADRAKRVAPRSRLRARHGGRGGLRRSRNCAAS
jgi:hypothetical protein